MGRYGSDGTWIPAYPGEPEPSGGGAPLPGAGGGSDPTKVFTDAQGNVWDISGGYAKPITVPTPYVGGGGQLQGHVPGGGSGLSFDQQMQLNGLAPDGQGGWYRLPSSSSSSSVNQTLLDPASIALQQEELRLKQIELNQKAASDAQNQQFLREKLAIETSQNNKTEARQTQQLMEQIAARQTQNELTRVGLMQDARNLQAQLEFSAAKANADAQMQAQQINEQRRTANLEQRRGVANDIAGFARNPGDVGANASYLLAGGANAPSGPSAISQAIAGGQDARTAQSLVPLDLLLSNRDELMKGPTLFQPSLVQAPNVQMPQFGAQQTAGTGAINDPNKVGWPAGWGPNGPTAGASGGNTNYGTWNSGNANTGYTGSVDANGNLVATPAMAAGGATSAPLFKGNEQGAELFINPTGAPIYVIPAPQTEKLTKGKKVPGYADGTLEPKSTDGTVNPVVDSIPLGIGGAATIGDIGNTQDTNRSLDFLNNAYRMALRGTPFAQSGAPTPVGLSAPGTSPFLQQMGAGLAAVGYGVNPALFLSEAQAAAPIGLSGAPTRRSR